MSFTRLTLFTVACAAALATAQVSRAQSPQRALLDAFAAEAKSADVAFQGFSGERGRDLFTAHPGTGKPETPSCTTCHTANPHTPGQTRAGKTIDPMAVSATPDRYTDPAKVAKWFLRNCTSVLGRECTAQEKGDFITFMISQ